ncbi:hypothetical protein GGR51DRAFT_518914 [Nemania sp. FL0031]|nr:hypothetical protein GGR51DRAFT_518914 [Nemania sp. FL0031]
MIRWVRVGGGQLAAWAVSTSLLPARCDWWAGSGMRKRPLLVKPPGREGDFWTTLPSNPLIHDGSTILGTHVHSMPTSACTYQKGIPNVPKPSLLPP